MYTWIKFIVFGVAALGSAIAFTYYIIARPKETTSVKNWKLYLAYFILFVVIAERYFVLLF